MDEGTTQPEAAEPVKHGKVLASFTATIVIHAPVDPDADGPSIPLVSELDEDLTDHLSDYVDGDVVVTATRTDE